MRLSEDATLAQLADRSGRAGPLAGVRVLDLTLAMAGPMSTQRLGELGADVIKIEAPGGGDFSRHWRMGEISSFGDALPYVTLNRNKRSMVLDLKSASGRAIFYRLVATADAVVVNYRPGVTKRLGIDYSELRRHNLRLVYVSITGYGEDGPMMARPGQDLLVQAFTGLTFNGGSKAGLPQASPAYMVDTVASHQATEAVLAGLYGRGQEGEGAAYTVDLMRAVMEMQVQEITAALVLGQTMPRSRSPQTSIWMEPPYGIYRTLDGFLAIAQADLDILANVLEEPRLAQRKTQRPTQSDIVALNDWRDDIYELVQDRLVGASAAAWDQQLSAVGVWCGVAQDYDAFLRHEQARGALVEVDHPAHGRYWTVAPGIRQVDAAPFQVRPAPAYGADTAAILGELGYSDVEIERFGIDGSAVARAAEPAAAPVAAPAE